MIRYTHFVLTCRMLAVSLVAGLAACSSSVPPGDVAARSGQPRVLVSETRAGTQQHVVLVVGPVSFTGTISVAGLEASDAKFFAAG